jgi:hypothetical protein
VFLGCLRRFVDFYRTTVLTASVLSVFILEDVFTVTPGITRIITSHEEYNC